MNLLDLNRSELERLCVENGQPQFRARQLIKWVHNKGIQDFSKMTDIQGSFRHYLSRNLNVHIPKIIQSTKSADGSEKWLFKLKKRKEQSSKIKEIQSPNGIKIQIGGNNRQNELISLKQGKKGDLWFHAQEIPGSHIVLKSSNRFIDEEDIQLSADLASFFSRAKGSNLVPVIMAPIENLQRISGALPGTVRHRGGKVLWGKAERAQKYFHQK